MTPQREKKLLQSVMAIACLVPLSAGIGGILLAVQLLREGSGYVGLNSHFAYLSGLLLGIGVAFVCSVWEIERHKQRVRLLAAIVVIGGLARLTGVLLSGAYDGSVLFALGMELLVTPLLALWQGRVAHRLNVAA